MRDFRVKRGISAKKNHDSRVKFGVVEEKMHDLWVECFLFFSFLRKVVISDCVFFQEKMRDLGLNGGLLKRKRTIFGLNSKFCREYA